MTDVIDDQIGNAAARLPDDFVFSQSSLQAYVDCKRRFWLAYLNRVAWPAPPASPVGEYEQLMRLGADFHRAVQRSEEGIIANAGPRAFPLEGWLRAYREHRPDDLPADCVQAEVALETPVDAGGETRRLLAKYDLIAGDSDRTVIVDWKTGAKVTRPAILQQKMQTSVYPYVLVEASHALPWGPVRPDQVEMRYWFSAAPDQTVAFAYSAAQHAANRERIVRLVEEILAGERPADFPKAPDSANTRKYVCGFCSYRGLCDRGVEATDLAELDDVVSDLDEPEAVAGFSLADVDEVSF